MHDLARTPIAASSALVGITQARGEAALAKEFWLLLAYCCGVVVFAGGVALAVVDYFWGNGA